MSNNGDGGEAMAKRGSMVVHVNTAIEGFENMASELAKARQPVERLPSAVRALAGGGEAAVAETIRQAWFTNHVPMVNPYLSAEDLEHAVKPITVPSSALKGEWRDDTDDHAADVMPYVQTRDSMKLITIPAGTLKAGDQINFEVVTSPWLKPEEWCLIHPADLEGVVRDAFGGKRQAAERRSQAKPVETEGDRLARFFATSAHEGHEQVRAEPERDEFWPMIDCGPGAAVRGDCDGDKHASAAFMDWGDTCMAVEMRRQDERRLAAALAQIPDDFDLLPDAE